MKDTTTLLNTITSQFPTNDSGQITAQRFRNFFTDLVGRTSTTWYVDFIVGNDTTNDGKSYNTPYKTISKLLGETINSGDIIYLAKGSHWREELNLGNKDYITIKTYGFGNRPVLDASDVAVNANFSLTSGRTNTYQISWTPLYGAGLAGGHMISVWEDEIRLIRRNSIDEVESNPGSFFTALPTSGVAQIVYIHPYGSTNPTSNNRQYEITKRLSGVLVRDFCEVEGIHTRNNGNNDGSFAGRRNCLVVDSVFEDGTKHNAFLSSGEFRDCVFWKCEEGSNHYNCTLGVFYDDDPSGVDAIVRGCVFIGGDGVNSNFNLPNGCIAIYGHGQNLNVRYRTAVIEDCQFYNVTSVGIIGAENSYISGVKAINCNDLGFSVFDATNYKNYIMENVVFVARGIGNYCVNIDSFPGVIIYINGLAVYSPTGNDLIRINGTGQVNLKNCSIIGSGSNIGIHVLGAGILNVHQCVFDNCGYQINTENNIVSLIADDNFYSKGNPGEMLWNRNSTNYRSLRVYRQAFPTIEQRSIAGNAELISNPLTGEFFFSRMSPIHGLKAGHSYFRDAAKQVYRNPRLAAITTRLKAPNAGVNPNNPVTPDEGGFAPNTVSASTHWAPRRHVAVTGTSITQLNDQIGTNHLTANGIGSPLLISRQVNINNQASALFDGKFNNMRATITGIAQPFFVIMVLNVINPIGGFIFDGASNESAGIFLGGSMDLNMNGGAFLGTNKIAPQNKWFILSFQFDSANTNSKVWVNGGTPSTPGNAGTKGMSNGITVGIKADGNSETACNMECAEIIIVPSIPSNANHNYLGTNLAYIHGGLTWTIPS